MNAFGSRDARELPWLGARVAVLGLGRSGEAVARALATRGARVTVLDSASGPSQKERAARLEGVHVALGKEDGHDIAFAHLVVASPGVPPSSRWLIAAEAQGVPVWSEVELAFRLGIEPAIAITGTNGKTTTTEMVTAALNSAGMPAVVAGNIGAPLVDADRSKLVVAELSSFQLQHIVTFRARAAVLLNIARDHLDWHGTFEGYVRAKARIFENQTADDFAIYHTDCASLAAWERAREIPFSEVSMPPLGAGVENGWIVVPQGRVIPLDALGARSRPNVADAVAAAAAACAIGADVDAVGRALAAYTPKPHRIEEIATIGGVTYINDSKATDPHATLAALEDKHDVVLIAGGRNKGLDLSELRAAADSLRAVIAIGESAAELEAAFEGIVELHRAQSMEEAVEHARALASPGCTILLSPACASFDMFLNYEARGEAFREAVKRIAGREL